MAGGVLGGPEDVRTAWQLLAGGAPTAANALVNIAENGKSEVARVQASVAILDRVGLAPPKEVTFRVQPEAEGDVHKVDPAKVIRDRLANLKGSLMAKGALEEAAHSPGGDFADSLADAWGDEDADVVDAEIVDEPWG